MMDVEERIKTVILPIVKGGFAEEDYIIQVAFELAKDEYSDTYSDNTLRATASRLTRQLLQEQYAEQNNWHYPTDYDRLVEVFDRLEVSGIIARHNYWCCGTCGVAAILEELTESTRGYVFYHEQDTDSVALGGTLYLNYGDAAGTDAGSLKVGQEIVESLIKAGFDVIWDGTLKVRIGLLELDWKKHRENPFAK